MESMPELERRDVVVMAMQQNEQEICWATQAGTNEVAFPLSYQISSYIDNQEALPRNFA